MEVLEAIKTRRCIRRYKPDPVPDEALETVLEAARWAPSGGRRETCRFIVVRNPDTRRKIAEIARDSARSRYGSLTVEAVKKTLANLPAEYSSDAAARRMMEGTWYKLYELAPVLIIVCANTERSGVWLQDASAAAQNILLAAHSLGLATCWTIRAVVDKATKQRTYELLGIPEGWEIPMVIPLGYPAEKVVSSRLPLEELVYYESFGRTKKVTKR